MLFSHSVMCNSAIPLTATQQTSLSITISPSLLKLMSVELVMPSNHLILCHPLLLLPSVFSSIRVFSKESTLCIRWPKYWSSSFSISPSNEYSGLISFRIDWFDLAVQGTLKGLLQHHISRASIFWRSAFLKNSFIHFNWRLITILWWFLPYINMNQPQMYRYPPILKISPTSLPTPSLQVVSEHQL